ncbi:MAG TPA: prolyl oligopeptidase family serine peptidase [Chthonomonadaceae bacterium]|nr:prolyl oligopeptidase family serine peptidase [Chthonomonadaceae bacterium]
MRGTIVRKGSRFSQRSLLLGFACLLGVLGGCGKRAPNRLDVKTLPGLGQARKLEPGVLFYEVAVPHIDGSPGKLWIYLPEHPSQPRLPCILIAPAGTPLTYGMNLAEGDRPEHLPYVRAGFAVVAYEIDGNVEDDRNEQQILAGARAFRDAEAGIANAKRALDYAVARVPGIDPNRIYTAGHSSAATLSLQVAEHEPRIQACIAYAPACSIPNRLGTRVLATYDRAIPGFSSFVERYSPDENVQTLHCPVFLFHADDDSNVPTVDVYNFYQVLEQFNHQVTFVRVPSGGHYDSMIQQGIPQAIRWLKSLPGNETIQ